MLLDFLIDHHAACPVCGYNLRGLARPVCPECKQDLVRTVGVASVRLGWLIVALAPGFFSGIAACFAFIPTLGGFIEDGTLFPPFVWGVLFGWCSGLFAILLAVKRNRFIALPPARQRWLALLVWAAHFAAFVVFVILLAPHWS